MNRSIIDRIFPLFFSPLESFGALHTDLSTNAQDVADLDVEDDDKSSDDDVTGEESDEDKEEESEEDDKKGDKKTKKDKEDDSEEDDKVDEEDKEEKEDEEDKEEEEEEDKEEDEDLENADEDSKTTLQSINKKYPKFFKEFPEVRARFFLAEQMSKVFGSVEDAQEAAEKSAALDGFTEAIEGGNSGVVIKSIAEDLGKDKALEFIDSFLPAIFEMDPRLWRRVTDVPIKVALRSMYNDAVKSKDKDQQLAARYAAKFIFGDDNIETATRLDNENKPVDRTKENEFAAKQLDASETYVDRQVRGRLEKSISKAIDPDNTMSDYIREALVSKAIDDVNKILEADKSHKAQLSSLWKKAQKQGYAADSTQVIVRAYLARASQSIPKVVAKVKVAGKAKKEVKGKETIPSEKHSNRSASQKVVNPGAINYRRTNDMDILNDNITLKGQAKK